MYTIVCSKNNRLGIHHEHPSGPPKKLIYFTMIVILLSSKLNHINESLNLIVSFNPFFIYQTLLFCFNLE